MSDRKIYTAEHILDAYGKIGITKNFADYEKRYKAILKSKRFRAAFPNYGKFRGDPILKKGSRGGSYADYGKNEIRLGDNHCETTLYHEIVHHIVRFHRDRYGPESGHGPGFIRAWLDFAKAVLGAEAERALRYSCSSARLKVWDAKKRKGVHIRTVANPKPEWVEKYGREKHEAKRERRAAVIEAARTNGDVNCKHCGGKTVMEITRFRPYRSRSYRIYAGIACVTCEKFEWQDHLPQDIQARPKRMPA